MLAEERRRGPDGGGRGRKLERDAGLAERAQDRVLHGGVHAAVAAPHADPRLDVVIDHPLDGHENFHERLSFLLSGRFEISRSIP